MVNPSYWGSEDSRGKVKGSSLFDTGQLKKDDDAGFAKNIIPLNEEMNTLRLNVNGTDGFLESLNRSFK